MTYTHEGDDACYQAGIVADIVEDLGAAGKNIEDCICDGSYSEHRNEFPLEAGELFDELFFTEEIVSKKKCAKVSNKRLSERLNIECCYTDNGNNDAGNHENRLVLREQSDNQTRYKRDQDKC